MAVDILYTRHEAFVVFENGAISRHKGSFKDEAEHVVHDVYGMPERPQKTECESDGVEAADICWRQECRNIEEMNAIAKEKQIKEYRQKVKLVRKQWKSQQPSLLARLLARVRN